MLAECANAQLTEPLVAESPPADQLSLGRLIVVTALLGVGEAAVVFLVSRGGLGEYGPVDRQALPFPTLVLIPIKTPDNVHFLCF